MRNIIARLLLSGLFVALTLSCYKDLSTEATQSLPDIEITSEFERLDVFYGETLTFTPEVRIKGRKASSIEYKWDMTLRPNDDEYALEIGNEKTLSYFVGNTPSSSPYIIRLTVTDKETGLVRSQSWNTFVSSPLGEGILVAHTADGGKTSDLSLLKAKPVTEGYASSPRITHNVFSMSNGGPIEGRVTALCPVVSSNMAAYNLNRIFIGTETDLIAVNYVDYKEDVRNGALFQFAAEGANPKVEAFFNYAGYAHGVISDGKFYNYVCNSSYLYSQVKYHNTPSEIFSTRTMTAAKYSQGNVYLVDVNQGKFYFMMGWMPGGSFQELTVNATYQLKGASPIACGIMKQDKAGFLVKTEDGAYYVTTINYSEGQPQASNFKVSDVAKNLDDAKGFAFCDNADFFYYYTDRSINVVIIAGKNVTFRTLTWEPENKNEKITGLYHYQQAWYGTQGKSEDEHLIDTHRLQMIITTYDETTGDGRIYLRPFNVTTGLFTKENNGVYEGFNEITAITPTLR